MLSFNVKCAIQVLAELEQAKAVGKRLRVTDLKTMCGFEGQSVSAVMSRLGRKNWVESTGGQYYMIIDLTDATLYDLVLAIDETLCMGHNVALDSWPRRNRDKYDTAIELDDCLTAEMEQRLKDIPLERLFPCHKSTGHKLPFKLQRRATQAKIVDGKVVFEQSYGSTI